MELLSLSRTVTATQVFPLIFQKLHRRGVLRPRRPGALRTRARCRDHPGTLRRRTSITLGHPLLKLRAVLDHGTTSFAAFPRRRTVSGWHEQPTVSRERRHPGQLGRPSWIRHREVSVVFQSSYTMGNNCLSECSNPDRRLNCDRGRTHAPHAAVSR